MCKQQQKIFLKEKRALCFCAASSERRKKKVNYPSINKIQESGAPVVVKTSERAQAHPSRPRRCRERWRKREERTTCSFLARSFFLFYQNGNSIWINNKTKWELKTMRYLRNGELMNGSVRRKNEKRQRSEPSQFRSWGLRRRAACSYFLFTFRRVRNRDFFFFWLIDREKEREKERKMEAYEISKRINNLEQQQTNTKNFYF